MAAILLRMALFATIVCIGISQAIAQEGNQPSSGFYYRDRYISYVPAHLRNSPQNERVNITREQNEEPVAQSDGQLVNWESEIEDQEMAEEMIAVADPSLAPVAAQAPCVAGSSCCITPTLFGAAELLSFWTKGTHVPALATTSPAGTPQIRAGVLGQANTTVLFGNENLNDEARIGGRFTLGMWLDPSCCQDISVTYFMLEEEASTFSASGADFSILARPFFNVGTNANDARQVVFPNLVSGSLVIDATTELQGWELLYRCKTIDVCCQRTSLLLGYRFMELEDHIRIDDSLTSLSGPTVGSTLELFDQFDTRNTFHGGEFGMATEWRYDSCWSLEGIAKVAVGQTIQRADLSAQTISTTAGGAAAVTQAGLLVQASNRGRFEEDEVGAVWELGLTIRRDFGSGWSASFGYSGLLWTDVFRAGEQMDLNINTSQIPPGTLVGQARPEFPFNADSFWAQGIHVGLAHCY